MLSSEHGSQCGQQKKIEKPCGTSEYQVGSRDTLRSIAVAFNTTTSKIMKLNKLSSNLIFPGQMLYVPNANVEEPVDGQCPSRTFDGDFSFLAPLTASQSDQKENFTNLILSPASNTGNNKTGNAEKPSFSYEDLLDFTTLTAEMRLDSPPHSTSTVTPESPPPLSSPSGYHDTGGSTVDDGRRVSSSRERVLSNESSMSEPFEENFLKMNVYYITPEQDVVEGVLLVTPTSVMYDPDPSDPLAVKYGCEKFGIMCNMSSIISATMFNDRGSIPRYSCSDSPTLPETDQNADGSADGATTSSDADLIDFGMVVTTEPISLLHTEPPPVEEGTLECGDVLPEIKSGESPEEKLMLEFPLLHSLAKTVGGIIPGLTPEEDDEWSAKRRDSMFLCVRSKMPMMKTFSTSFSGSSSEKDKQKQKEDVIKEEEDRELKESWFQVKRNRSDQLLAFFMQWSPDPYALDLAEQSGFVITDVIHDLPDEPHKQLEDSDASSRTRTSTNASLEFVDDFFSDARIEKEWEIVSVEEARRRSTIGALELANDDTSLIPDLLSTSNLLNESHLITLCKNLPARSVGCPWKLLYSTFEHGMSLRTLYRRVAKIAEDTPVAILVQDTEEHVFGAVLSCPPRVTEHFCGTGESFLFTLEPKPEIFRWSGENMFFVKGDVDSLKIGGGDGQSALWLDGDLCHGRSHPCLTFNNTVLSSSEDFFIQGVEVWSFHDG